MLDANKNAKTQYDEEAEFEQAAWREVLELIVRLHAEVTTQCAVWGKIVSVPELKRIVGSVHCHRRASHRLALRLYGYWLISPSEAMTWFKEWVDEEFDADIPDSMPDPEGGYMSDR